MFLKFNHKAHKDFSRRTQGWNAKLERKTLCSPLDNIGFVPIV
jgi:hypothetical protein